MLSIQINDSRNYFLDMSIFPLMHYCVIAYNKCCLVLLNRFATLATLTIESENLCYNIENFLLSALFSSYSTGAQPLQYFVHTYKNKQLL